MAMTLDDALKMYQAQKSGGAPQMTPPKEYFEQGAPRVEPQAAERTAEDVTMAELEGLCKEIAEQRMVCDQVAAVKKEQDRLLDDKEKKLLDLLRLLEKDSFKSNVGTFSVSHRLSVRVPGNAEDKQAFFDYLKARGLFDQMITVNSQTLNSFYKAEFEAAKESGEGMDFAMPGIGEPSISETISFRKSK
jgi:hypothetical protein